MKRFVSAALILILLVHSVTVFAITDENIFTDPVRNTFRGRTGADALINNLNFTDLPGKPVFEPVARVGALNIIKGHDGAYVPNEPVSNVVMLSTVLRAMGRESDAVTNAATLMGRLPENSDLRTELKAGYLGLANQLGFINAAQFGNVLAADQSALDPATAFIYDNPVTRQQAAAWLVRGLLQLNPNAFAGTGAGSIQKTFNYSDWSQVSAANLPAVELLAASGVMVGSDGKFRPNDPLTRAELAYLYKKLDNIYYNLVGLQKRNGTVGGIKKQASVTTGSGSYGTAVYIRVSDGKIDVIRNYAQLSASAPATLREVPVFKNDAVAGLGALEEGDEIEYIVNPTTNEALYISVVKNRPITTEYVRGKYQSVTGSPGAPNVASQITIKNESGDDVTFTLAEGMHVIENSTAVVFEDGKEEEPNFIPENDIAYLYIDGKKQELKNLPINSTIILRLINNICDEIQYVGEPNAAEEFRGIVLENDPDLGYLVVLDNKNRRIIKDFYTDDIKVKKREYYQNDNIGYIDEVFPYFKYNPLESDISAIEPGDIVFIVNDPDNIDYIKSISAATNYIARYGKVIRYEYNATDGYYEMLLEYENKQTSWFVVPEELFISRLGKPATADSIVIGDWARVLVNQAIIAPGYVMESAKEIMLEGAAHYISTILKGQLAGINPTQNQLLVQNVQTLTKTGWTNYKQTANFNLTGRDIEYYHNGKQISLDYALKYFKRSDGEVYIALENNYAGEKVRKVTFRFGRDELLGADTVLYSDGNGNFSVMSNAGDNISTDAGTIVRRYGRLVDGAGIAIPDYAVVSLNGGNNAAVVDIADAPTNAGVQIYRGQVLSVDEGKTFDALLQRQLVPFWANYKQWNQMFLNNKVYDIDYNTKFLTPTGLLSYDKFIDYQSAVAGDPGQVYGQFYNIITEGSRAAWIIDSPICLMPNQPSLVYSVRGTVYGIEQGALHIKDAYYLAANGGSVKIASPGTLVINLQTESVILKNNQVVGQNSVVIGNDITVITDTYTNMPNINGYLVFVDQ